MAFKDDYIVNLIVTPDVIVPDTMPLLNFWRIHPTVPITVIAVDYINPPKWTDSEYQKEV